MSNVLKTAVEKGQGNAILVAGFLGLILSDVIPTLGDAAYFWDQRRLKKLLEDKKITAKQYWLKNAAGYYLYNSAWWALIFGTVMMAKTSFDGRIKLAAALIGGGAVIGVISKNIKKDQENESTIK